MQAAWRTLINEYSSHLAGLGRSGYTLRVRVGQMERFASAITVGPEKVTTAILITYMGSKPDWGPHMRNSARASLRSFFSWAAEYKHLPTDPSFPLPRQSVPRTQPRPISTSAVAAALDRADSRTRLMIMLAADAGLKAAEIANCNARDLHQDADGNYTLRAVKSNGRTRTVKLRPELAEAIIAAGDGFTFPGRVGGHVSNAYVTRLISQALPEGVSSEDLRHALAAGQVELSWRAFAHFSSTSALEQLNVEHLSGSATVARQLGDIERELKTDPASAVGSCKEMLESVFKIVLTAMGVAYSKKNDDMPDLSKKVELALVSRAPEEIRASIRMTFRTLANLVTGVTQTRNDVDGHGSEYDVAIEARHARLVFNATVAVVEYVVETWSSTENAA
jgi:integrase